MAAARAKIEKSDEAYRSIGEAAKQIGLPTHVLRYWETKFPRHVRPVKRPDGRRLYRPSDIDGLRAIQTLVHKRGMTLKGAKALLQEQGIEIVLRGASQELGAAMVGSPVHSLQKTVETAFGDAACQERAASRAGPLDLPDGVQGSPERLRAVLGQLTDLKARIDAAKG